MDFIGLFNSFFEFLLEKITEYENDLLDQKEIIEDCFFSFNFNEFYEKDILKPYSDMLTSLGDMFPHNNLMQGITFYMHLNTLLKRHKFNNNKIRVVDKLPAIDIDYGSRISFYKEEYITIFRNELEEGIRDSVFLDNDEIINYIKKEIEELEDELDI